MSDLRKRDTAAVETAEKSAADIVERALAILDEEARAWVIRQQELATIVAGPSTPRNSQKYGPLAETGTEAPSP